MYWIVEKNNFNEARYGDVLQALERGNISHSVVEISPKLDTLHPEVFPQGPIAIIGSYDLVRIATNRGWGPGVFSNDNHQFMAWKTHYGEYLLNSDSEIMEMGDLDITSPVFIRPCHDSKAFSGRIFTPSEVVEWKHRIGQNPDRLTLKTLVCTSTIKLIYSEFRIFVLDGQIITGSRYKLGGVKAESEYIPENIIEFAREVIRKWQPSRGFALDVAETEKGTKIIEINNLNSAGFYRSNVSKLIQSIEQMPLSIKAEKDRTLGI